MTTRKEVADGLKRACNSYFLKKGYACHNEIAVARWGKFKVDMLAVNLRGDLVVGEVKSCVSDFKTDHLKQKWHNYLPACNRLYFVFDEKTTQLLEPYFDTFKKLGCGVLTLSSTTGYLRCTLSAKHRKMTGADKRNIITRLAWRSADVSKRTSRRTRVFLNHD